MANEDAVSQESGSERVVAGRYSLLSPLGAGGMGTVWRAYDKVLHREVAIKEVRAPAGLAAPDIERMYTRLEREAWAAARVAHPNVVTVYDVAMEEGRPWIVMELVRGQSLADLLKTEGRLSPQRAASIGLEVLAALHAAHETGVLHRDVKPANVLIARDGRVVLTDFGIAMIEGDSALTMTGEVVGSPEFLSPERALGQRSGPASDLWSLGVLLYAAVEARSPSARTPRSAPCGPSWTRSCRKSAGPAPSLRSSRDCCARIRTNASPPSRRQRTCGSSARAASPTRQSCRRPPTPRPFRHSPRHGRLPRIRGNSPRSRIPWTSPRSLIPRRRRRSRNLRRRRRTRIP